MCSTWERGIGAIDEPNRDKLDEWFKPQGRSTRDLEYDLVYVNRDNNLENLRRPDPTWKVRLIEEEFKRLMFDVQDVQETSVADETPPTGDQKKHYFVDEAGDPVLFNHRKQIVVGTEGCSTFFMLGLLDVAAPEALGKELDPNQLYDRCVARLFKERLHKDNAYRIVFAKRGASDRTAALLKALENARNNLRRSWRIEGTAPIEVIASVPVNDPSLQAADYFLWALQRFYEKKEVRYWEFVWSKVSLVHDIDDVENNEYGEYYSQRNPLTLAALERRSPGI